MKFSMDPVRDCRGHFLIYQANILERASPALIVFCVSVLFSLAIADEISASEAIEDDALFFDSIPSVFGASKHEQKVTDAPATVSVINAHTTKGALRLKPENSPPYEIEFITWNYRRCTQGI